MDNLRLMSWNVEGRLTYTQEDEARSTPAAIAAVILNQQPDVAFLAESTRSENLSADVRSQFEGAGYVIVECEYDETERLAIEPGVATHSLLLCKLPIESADILRYGGQRQLPVVRIRYQSELATIAGVHLDDRAEADRTVQAHDMTEAFANEEHLICLGDFNAMSESVRSRILRSRLARVAARMVPHAFMQSAATRVNEMAQGETMRILTEELSLRDADEKRLATATPKLRGYEWLPSIRLIQIDHILLSRAFQVVEFKVLPDGGSDHRAIVCDITLDKTRKI